VEQSNRAIDGTASQVGAQHASAPDAAIPWRLKARSSRRHSKRKRAEPELTASQDNAEAAAQEADAARGERRVSSQR
jgi:hypothetical protein